jgi:hypothetical protein
MAQLTNPIVSQNIVDRFADYVVSTANSGISWGTNAKPFSEMSSDFFGGTTAGRGIAINGNSVGAPGTNITASGIYNTLLNETIGYSNIRLMRALLFVTGGGGNTGSRPTQGYIYDSTAVAHLSTNYRQGLSPNASNVSFGNTITAGGLEQLFDNMRAAYNSARSSTATIQVDVCHASCHSSCHSSRGRR